MDDECSKLLFINIHRGLYKFERLPLGVKVAPAIFQQVIAIMLSGLEFALAYLNDILINSQSAEQHKVHMYEVFKRIQDIFLIEKIKYLGQIIDKDGRRPDTGRASAIKNIPVPENVFSIQCFLGLANNYNVSVPNIHIHSLQAPFNELIKNEKDRVWTTECQEAFEKIKKSLHIGFILYTL